MDLPMDQKEVDLTKYFTQTEYAAMCLKANITCWSMVLLMVSITVLTLHVGPWYC